MSKDDRVRELIARWSQYRGALPEPQRFDQLKGDLYCARNPKFNGCPPLSAWPANLIDSDDEIMAAVEHYFLTRAWVGNLHYPAAEVEFLTSVYDHAKRLGLKKRHNPGKPVTPHSAMQRRFQTRGIADGESDLKASGLPAPGWKLPPTY